MRYPHLLAMWIAVVAMACSSTTSWVELPDRASSSSATTSLAATGGCTPGDRAACHWVGTCNPSGTACECDDPVHYDPADQCGSWQQAVVPAGLTCLAGDLSYCHWAGACAADGSGCECDDPEHYEAAERCSTWHQAVVPSGSTCLPGDRSYCHYAGACTADGAGCECDDPGHYDAAEQCDTWHPFLLQSGERCAPGDRASCDHHGTCDFTGTTCVCDDWFHGPTCSVTSDQCPGWGSLPGPPWFSDEVCGGNGTCEAVGVCACDPGFSGESCEDDDPWATLPLVRSFAFDEGWTPVDAGYGSSTLALTVDAASGRTVATVSTPSAEHVLVDEPLANANHALWQLEITGLEATRTYLLRARVDGTDVVDRHDRTASCYHPNTGSDPSLGAKLDAWAAGGFDSYPSLKDNGLDAPLSTGTWTDREFLAIVRAGGSGEMTVQLGLGAECSHASGHVGFDEVELRGPLVRYEVELPVPFYVDLEPQQDAVITEAEAERWAGRLADAYVEFVDLVGREAEPDDRHRGMIPTRFFRRGPVSSHPITYGWIGLQEVVEDTVAPHDNISWGLLHEMGHWFASGVWNFHSEPVANWLPWFVMEQMPDATAYRAYYGGQYYTSDTNTSWGLAPFDPSISSNFLDPAICVPGGCGVGAGTDMDANPPVRLEHMYKRAYELERHRDEVLAWMLIRWARTPGVGSAAFRAAFHDLIGASTPPDNRARWDGLVEAVEVYAGVTLDSTLSDEDRDYLDDVLGVSVP